VDRSLDHDNLDQAIKLGCPLTGFRQELSTLLIAVTKGPSYLYLKPVKNVSSILAKFKYLKWSKNRIGKIKESFRVNSNFTALVYDVEAKICLCADCAGLIE